MASFADGVIIIFDKDRDDEPFHPENRMMTGFRISKPSPKISGRKTNPVSHWKLSNKSITAFAFSPDCQHVAVVGLDGLLRIINFVRETLIDIYQAYYGGFTCVSWSPDGQYILTGGEDDLVTMWAFHEQRIVARCQGHKSFVTDVAFDPWRCDENVYRFASVGEDAKLILWDFSVNALHRPKTRTTGRVRGSSVSSQHQAPTSAYKSREDNQPTLHPIQSKNHVAFLQPTVVKAIHADPCVGIYFREDVIVTTDRRGRVSVWQRPPKTTSSPKASNQRYV
ncbi:WD40-repeat-containing domain protein [Dichotomocladium elegans]|nr:WD40-repeat-containing domain protein [Dichotomocladium elegans]